MISDCNDSKKNELISPNSHIFFELFYLTVHFINSPFENIRYTLFKLPDKRLYQ
jgi:hypothetical protein